MDSDWLDYPTIVQEALRDAVRHVLAQVAEHGMPGEHHFFLAFRTDHPGVIVPRFLRDLYPDEIKIVVQHQYWDLEVDDDLFSITVSFNGQRQRLTVPFTALTLFVDPTAEFMLRFDGGVEAPTEEDMEDLEAEEADIADIKEEPVKGPRAVPNKPAEVLQFDPSRRK